MRILILICIFVSSYSNIMISNDTSFDILMKDPNTITFSFKTLITGWICVGLGSSSVMNVDTICVEFIDGNSYKLSDLYSKGLYKLNEDISYGGKDDLTNKIFTFQNNTYSLSFDRLLNTSDPFDFVITKGQNISITFTSYAETPMNYKRKNIIYSGFYIDSSNIIYFDEVQSSGKIDFYSIKGVILIISWIFLNFIGITFAAFCRHKSAWIYVHRVCCGLGGIMSIIFGFIAIADHDEGGRSSEGIVVTHRIFGILIMIISFFQLFFGNVIYFIQTSETLKNGWIHNFKWIHKIGGFLVTIFALINLGTGGFMKFDLYGVVFALIIIYGIGMIVFRVRNMVKENNKIINFKDIFKSSKSKNIKVFSRSELEELKKEKKIVYLDNYIIDVTEFIENHPGGQIHLLENINHDVSRYLYGITSINPSFQPHSHSVSTYKHIYKNMIIGVLREESGLITNMKKESEVIDTELMLISSRYIAKEINEFKFAFKNQFPNVTFTRFIHGYKWVGRHIALSSVLLNRTRYYSICLCLNEIIYNKHKILLENIERLRKKEEIISPDLKADEVFSDCLELYIKKYEVEGGLSKYLHEMATQKEEIVAKGPIGLGLNLDKKELSGVIVAFAGGTGVFCFLDFLAFILRFICNKIASTQYNEKFNRINKEDFSMIRDDFQLYYFSTFSDEESSIFNEMCEKLYDLDKRYNINVFKFYSRFSVNEQKRWDFEFVNEKLDKVEKIGRAFVCGPTTFRNDMKQILLNTKKVDTDCIQLV